MFLKFVGGVILCLKCKVFSYELMCYLIDYFFVLRVSVYLRNFLVIGLYF